MSIVTTPHGSTSERVHMKCERRPSQGETVTLPAVELKLRPALVAPMRSSDPSASRSPLNMNSSTGVVPSTRITMPNHLSSQQDLLFDASESLFALESEDDEEDGSGELFPLLKRQSLTEPPKSSGSNALHPAPIQPPASAKELTRAFLNTRFHSRRVHTPVRDLVNGDHDSSVDRSPTPVQNVAASSNGAHSAEDGSACPPRTASNQITADFADFIHQHLSELKERRAAPIYFHNAKQSPSCSSGSARTSSSIQWHAFEFREEDAPTSDNPFTQWSILSPMPASPVLSNLSNVSHPNLSSETDGLSESSRPVTDNPLTRLASNGFTASTCPVVTPLAASAPNRRQTTGSGSIVVPTFSKDGSATGNASLHATPDLPTIVVLTPSKRSSGDVVEMITAAHSAPSRCSRDIRVTSPLQPSLTSSQVRNHSSASSFQSHSLGSASRSGSHRGRRPHSRDALDLDSSLNGVPLSETSETLSAMEVQFNHPVSPSGRRVVEHYTRTFSRIQPAQPGKACSGSLTAPPPPLPCGEQTVTLSAPTDPLTYPPVTSRRPILSAKLAHKNQLARRALEDNELFFQRRMEEATAESDNHA